eukprot:286129-Rhodomonas_salina.4
MGILAHDQRIHNRLVHHVLAPRRHLVLAVRDQPPVFAAREPLCLRARACVLVPPSQGLPGLLDAFRRHGGSHLLQLPLVFFLVHVFDVRLSHDACTEGADFPRVVHRPHLVDLACDIQPERRSLQVVLPPRFPRPLQTNTS